MKPEKPLGCPYCGCQSWRHGLAKTGPRKLVKRCGRCDRIWQGEVERDEDDPPVPERGDRILVLDYTGKKKTVF